MILDNNSFNDHTTLKSFRMYYIWNVLCLEGTTPA